MPKTAYKKPKVSDLTKALEKTGGNLTDAAKLLGCNRSTLRTWAHDDEEFAEAISASRKQMLDQCITTARLVAQGIPLMENGRFVGWQVTPDSNMLRYLMSTLGRDEEFGESMTIRHTTDEGVDIGCWIEREIEMKRAAQKNEVDKG
ncbi:MAG: helix-turn-helix domain-containing protein [Bacteroidales bacterium]|nr:helix-turn-helix domain-containing protein [Bacteroidales bacterium]